MKSGIKNYSRFISFIVLLLSFNSAIFASEAGSFETEYYRVENGKVDPGTFLGWSLYNDTCVACHGVGGSGSEIAPDLTKSLEKYPLEQFQIWVLKRYLVTLPADAVSAENTSLVRDAMLAEIAKEESKDPEAIDMPKWDANPVVKTRIRNIYSYLKARADGVLGPDRPGVSGQGHQPAAVHAQPDHDDPDGGH